MIRPETNAVKSTFGKFLNFRKFLSNKLGLFFLIQKVLFHDTDFWVSIIDPF